MNIKKVKYLILPSLAILFLVFAQNVFGQTFQNPLGYDNVNGLLAKVLSTIQGIVAGLAVLMMVVGGVLYITSGGNQGQVDLAKKAVTSAIIGLVLVLAAPAFVRQIYEIMGMGASVPSNVPSSKTLSDIIISTIKFVASLVGALSVLMLVVGGIMYIVSGGDTQRTDTAKNIIKYAIIGLVISISALIIVTQIVNLFQ